ncbi:MAG: 4Fe-4S dicluster-binding protein, partial [Thermodesulfobacteriota bacterium]
FQVRRKEDNCIDCGKCDRICPSAIVVSRKKSVRTAECIGCLECIQVCPAKECLSLAVPQKKEVPPLLLPALVLSLFFLCYLLALMSGHWQTQVPLEAFQHYYQMIDNIGHP